MKKLLLILFIVNFLVGCRNGDGELELKMECFQKDTVIHLLNIKENPSLKLQIKMELPVSYKDTEVLKALQASICKGFTGKDSTITTANEAMKVYTKKWEKEYRGLEKDFVRKDSLDEEISNPNMFNWDVKLKGTTVLKDKGLFSYLTESNSVAGGESAGSFIVRGINMLLENGKELALEDFFNEDFHELLIPCLISKIRKENNITDDVELETIGYFAADEISVSHNFVLSKEGITFLYNPGEIAAPMIGVVSVKMSYDELSFVMKENSPIVRFVN